MDSVGATARTPRLQRPSMPLNWLLGGHANQDSPTGSRTLDASYGSIPASARMPSSAAHRDSSAFKTPTHSYLHPSHLPPGEPLLPVVVNGSNEPRDTSSSTAKVAMYGVLNTVICIPIMISFAQIIFRDPAFQPYMSDLIKLVLTSAAVHQLCFTVSSSLPFAVGQVQDAGLIFLSAMASSVVQGLRQHPEQQFSMEEVIATTLFTLAASTALLGVALIITGKLRIASFVQYLPMPVVGGYLAFIGFYCLEAGLSMMANKTIKDPSDWMQLANTESLVLLTPGVLAGLLIFYALSKYDHVAILPSCMVIILALFYVVLLVSGLSLDDARAAGWVAPQPAAPRSISEVYKLYDLSLMDTSFLLPQLPTWVAMYFVVAFSSSLDVAAIEMSLGTSLNHNHELQTVGLSNLVSGLTGGFTGSYIFSQTILTLRAKISSRANGALICLLEIALVLCPFSVIAYVPKVFFGALQTLIAADLMIEWMWHARHKMLLREYAVVWLTFLIMNVFNLEVGILLGIVAAAFNFIWSYIAATSVRRVMKRSRVERDLRERELLQRECLSIVTLELDGFIFFGSSVKMMEEVRKHVLVNASVPPLVHHRVHHGAQSETDTELEGLTTLDAEDHSASAPTPALFSSAEYARLAIHAVRTRFFILDFERVRGVDATAVRSCFLATRRLLEQHGIVLLFASVPPAIEKLLQVHDVLEGQEHGAGLGVLVFETLDKALEWCEDEILIAEGVMPLSDSMPREDDGKKCRMQLLHELLPKHPDKSLREDPSVVLTKELGELYIEPVIKQAGECIYRSGQVVAGMYFVGYGKVDVYLPSKLHEGMGPGFSGRKRILRVCQGGIIAASELILNKRHQFTAEAKATTFLFFLSKAKYRKMQQQHPRLAARFQQAMLHSMARSVMESNIADD
ncbi:hypothetical protein P43SY_002311 [Pythium insidiosum]|uniref:Sulfate Permease (SulP) Family n=1 Tax=Pythium insidiosum TaxID=114742 RepID=A0AAD5MBN8_PYTIN|nr:hypothetical protein P43SY_002311 [Pythium insidiosum]